MIYIESTREFRERVHVLYSPDFTELGLDIVADSPLGFFDPESVPRLVEFCDRHPELHIVTVHGLTAINTCILGGSTYLLANGDRNPRLVHDPDGEIEAPFYGSQYARFRNRAPNFNRSA